MEVHAPKYTHVVELRGHPGHMGGVLGLVGFEGRRRSPEQAVGGAVTAVAREEGNGTAAEQACTKGKKMSKTQVPNGGRGHSHTRNPRLPPSRFLYMSRWALEKL